MSSVLTQLMVACCASVECPATRLRRPALLLRLQMLQMLQLQPVFSEELPGCTIPSPAPDLVQR
jgi:hypothetical protein